MKLKELNLTFSEDHSAMDLDLIHHFLAKESYWAQDRSKELVAESLRNSYVAGLFKDKKQIAFARVISDFATFAYLCDVFLDEAHRNQGIGEEFLKEIFKNSKFKNVRWHLRTSFSKTLYLRLGFQETKPEDINKWMSRDRQAPSA